MKVKARLMDGYYLREKDIPFLKDLGFHVEIPSDSAYPEALESVEIELTEKLLCDLLKQFKHLIINADFTMEIWNTNDPMVIE